MVLIRIQLGIFIFYSSKTWCIHFWRDFHGSFEYVGTHTTQALDHKVCVREKEEGGKTKMLIHLKLMMRFGKRRKSSYALFQSQNMAMEVMHIYVYEYIIYS